MSDFLLSIDRISRPSQRHPAQKARRLQQVAAGGVHVSGNPCLKRKVRSCRIAHTVDCAMADRISVHNIVVCFQIVVAGNTTSLVLPAALQSACARIAWGACATHGQKPSRRAAAAEPKVALLQGATSGAGCGDCSSQGRQRARRCSRGRRAGAAGAALMPSESDSL